MNPTLWIALTFGIVMTAIFMFPVAILAAPITYWRYRVAHR